MRRSIGIIIVTIVLGGMGCVDEPDTGTESPGIEVVTEGSASAGVPDMVIFESRMESKFGLPDLLDPHGFGTVVVDPCECVTPACLDSWAQRNLGCNVCVSLYCDGVPGAHVCSGCDDPT